jgi:hypothetical protein
MGIEDMTGAKLIRRTAVSAMVVVALALSGCGITKGKTKSTPTVGVRVPILSKIDSGTKVDEGMSALDVVLPVAEANSDWEQAGGTASKSYGHLVLAEAPRKLWTARIAGSSPEQRLAAAPVIGGGKLYVMDTEGLVHAFDAKTGHQAWEDAFRLPMATASVFGGGAAYNDGKVFITTGLGEVAAIDAADGKVIWRVKAAGPLRGSPTIAFGGVYVMTQDNRDHGSMSLTARNCGANPPRSRRPACSASLLSRLGRARSLRATARANSSPTGMETVAALVRRTGAYLDRDFGLDAHRYRRRSRSSSGAASTRSVRAGAWPPTNS